MFHTLVVKTKTLMCEFECKAKRTTIVTTTTAVWLNSHFIININEKPTKRRDWGKRETRHKQTLEGNCINVYFIAHVRCHERISLGRILNTICVCTQLIIIISLFI